MRTKIYQVLRNFYLLYLLLSTTFLNASQSDTIHVISHNRQVVVTDPSKGYNLYSNWAVFPGRNMPIRKILLHVEFGCPDSMRCADWDYLDHITIRRTGGIKGDSTNFEIGRMLTPYGGAFAKDWSFEWVVDVTDFSLLLRDSVEIEYNHTGYESNKDRGWLITLDFEIIKGKPVVEPIKISKLYEGNFAYGDSLNPIEKQLAPVSFSIDKQGRIARMRVYHTGHGMDDPAGCGEFCSKKRDILFDNILVDRKSIWKECGDNPLYPQAGTWIFDRANWCPGYLQIPDIYDFDVTPHSTHTIDINMENYLNKKPSANEVINAYLIQYKKPGAENDATIDQIIVPNKEKLYSRLNPSSGNPQIVVRNSGGQTIKELLIRYGVVGYKQSTYTWNGEIGFNKTAMISLPKIDQPIEDKGFFKVEVLKVNGKSDEFKKDNVLTSEFNKPPVYQNNLVIYFRTNNQPEQNGLSIIDRSGNSVYQRITGSLKANTVYRDTLKLPAGSYELFVQDTAGDGLEFWYNVEGGRGICRLLNLKGELVKNFESDFGSSIYHSFILLNDSTINNITKEPSIGLFPTRTKDKTTLDYFANNAQKVVVQLLTDTGGEVVEEHVYNNLKEGVFTYDLSYRSPQRYYLKVFINGELKFNKRVRVGQ